MGAVALSAVALVAVDMPGGYLGPADRLSAFGLWYGVAMIVMAGLLVVVPWSGPGPKWAALGVLGANVGVFLPTLPADPVVGVTVVAWHVLVLGVEVFGIRLRSAPWQELEGPNAPPPRRSEWQAATVHLAVVGVLLSLLVVGFRLSTSPFAVTTAVLATLVPAGIALVQLARRGKTTIAIGLALAVLAVSIFASPPAVAAAAALANVATIVEDLLRGELFRELLHSFLSNPALLIIATFVGLVFLGTLLLTFPAASASGVPIHPIDALFTATSAACVTGLAVLDTPSDFTLFGHIVIFALFQIGGLGIMVLSTFATLLVGARLGLRGERALGEIMDIRDPASAYRLVKFVIGTTLVVEAAGAAILAWRFHEHGKVWGDAIWTGVFHSVSAFCNAGFALYSDSLVSFADDPTMLATHMALIVIGGIGFVVVAVGWSRYVSRDAARLDLQSKIVLSTSAILLAVGFVLFAALEWDGALAVGDATWSMRLWNAAFQSVTFRTAGFNSVPYDNLTSATILMMLGFMLIGASPGSTGGGIKTTTFAVLVAAVRGILRGDAVAELFGREIPQEIVYRSAAITVVTSGFLGAGLFLLFLTDPEIPFAKLVFESFSAIATVGLSLGITAELSPPGKLVVVIMMFAGRVGPVTLALVLSRRRKKAHVLPRSSVMVG